VAKDIALNIGLKSEIVPSSVPPSAGTNKTLKGLSLVPSALKHPHQISPYMAKKEPQFSPYIYIWTDFQSATPRLLLGLGHSPGIFLQIWPCHHE